MTTLVLTLAGIATGVYAYHKASKLFASKDYEEAFTLKNRCKAYNYTQSVLKDPANKEAIKALLNK